MNDYKPGDEVRVFPVFGVNDVPAAGWPADVTAVRTGEIDALVTNPDGGDTRTLTFALEDSRSTGNGGQFIFRTVERAERKGRREAALSVLGAYCITVETGSGVTTEQLETLAEVVKQWED